MPGTFSHKFDNESFKGPVSIHTDLFIDGKWVPGSNGTTIEYAISLPIPALSLTKSPPFLSVINPATEQVLTKVSEANAKDVDLAVDAAHRAFETTWGHNIPSSKRGLLLNKLADVMESQYDALCAVEALDNGERRCLITRGRSNADRFRNFPVSSHRQDFRMGKECRCRCLYLHHQVLRRLGGQGPR